MRAGTAAAAAMALGGVLYHWFLRDRLLNWARSRRRWRRGCRVMNCLRPERVFASRSASGNWFWTFVLQERDGQTRLISRNRFRLPTPAWRIGMAPMIPGSLVMEQKMLRGIKARAERLVAERAANPSA